MSDQPLKNDDEGTRIPSKRFNTKEMAQVEVYGRMGKVFCKMSNLSASGAFLEIINSNYMPRSGDLVRMTILLRQINKTHVIDAEIIWSRGLGLGINFLKKSDLVEKLSGRLSAA